MKLLELFSGTHSVGNIAKQLGYEVISLDLKKADININILTWDYKKPINLIILILYGLVRHAQNIQ